MKNIEEKFEEWCKEDKYICNTDLLSFTKGYETAKREYEAKLKEAVEVIKFYGDEMNYDIDNYYGLSGQMRYRCVLNKDREERNDVYQYAGKKAREFLKSLNNKE